MKKMNENLLNINLIITKDSNGIPMIELRKVIKMNTENKQAFIQLIKSAYNEEEIILLPTFTNKLISISRMLKEGWIEKVIDKDGITRYKPLF